MFSCGKEESKVDEPVSEKHRRVVAYLPHYRLTNFNPEQIKLVTDVVLFSIFPDPATGDFRINQTNADGSMVYENKNGAAGLKETDIDIVLATCKANGVKAHICFGGGSFAVPFRNLVDNGMAPAFAQNVKNLCLEKGFDGVDIDWEFPQATDVAKVGTLLRALYEVLHPEEISLSGAFASSLKWQKPSIESAVNNAHMLDMINVMGYTNTMVNMNEAYNVYVEQYGVDREKIIPGVPFYTFGTGAAKGKPYFWLMDLCTEKGVDVLPERNQLTVDDISYRYNGVDYIKKKVNYGMEKLGGIMIWEIGHDIDPSEDLSLLKAVDEAVKASL